jgi:hypothetical protein
MLKKSKTDKALRLLLTYGVETWLGGEEPDDIDPPDDHPFAAQLREASREQTALGWNQILRGRISKAWGDCYVSWVVLTAKPGTKPSHDPLKWTTKIAKWGLQLALDLWDNRNTLIHAPTAIASQGANHSRTQACVRERYNRCSSMLPPLPTGDHNAYFGIPLDVFLMRSANTLQAWIVQVDRIFIRHRKEISQRSIRGTITHYFHRL